MIGCDLLSIVKKGGIINNLGFKGPEVVYTVLAILFHSRNPQEKLHFPIIYTFSP